MEYKRQCVECGVDIIIYRRYPVTPSQESELKKYCHICRGKILKGRPPHHLRKEKRYKDNQGYIKILVNGVHVFEHRYVMEKKLGRKLKKGEIVHHSDENRSNNKPGNLSLYPSNGVHCKDHFSGKPQKKLRKRGC